MRAGSPLAIGQYSGPIGSILASRNSPDVEARWASFRKALGRKSESEQAGAKQHETGCGQGKEALGDKVMVAHVTPSRPNARPNLLKLSERAHC